MKTINNKIFGLDLLRRRQFETKGDLIKYHTNKLEQLNKDGADPNTLLQDMSDVSILFEHLYDGRRLELDMASQLEEKNFHDPASLDLPVQDNINDLLFEDSPITVNYYDDKYLVIDTPIIFKNAERYSNEKDLLLLATYISAARKHFENINNVEIANKITAPYWMIIVRKIGRDNYQNFADSDNIELKKVSNVIAQFLGLSDSPVAKRECTLTEQVAYKEDIGMTIIVIKEENVTDFLDKFIKNKGLKFLKQ